MSQDILKEWKRQAHLAGKDAEGKSYLEEYEYHLGMMSDPLPFQQWRAKYDELTRLQAMPEEDPRYFAPSTFKREHELCLALGY